MYARGVGSTPPYQRLVLPRAGAVSPNGAIVVDAHVVGAASLGITAHADANAIEVTYAVAPPFSTDRFGGGGARYLVRPTRGDWPCGATVRLTIANGANPPVALDAPIAELPDRTPPAFSSLGRPTLRTLARPGLRTEVTAITHEPFDDPESPLVLVELTSDHRTHRLSAVEGSAGVLFLEAKDNTRYIDAITLTDLAGNRSRIPAPCGPREDAMPFECVAGSLEPQADGTFVATTDAGTADGFSRGHYLWREIVEGDIEVEVVAERLTGEHEMPIELAFRGGFFAVTGTSSWFLYENDHHWTGWQPTPVPVKTGWLALRVVQRGTQVSGYVDEQLVGSFTLQNVHGRAVGVAFKARPGERGSIRFRDFTVRRVDPPTG